MNTYALRAAFFLFERSRMGGSDESIVTREVQRRWLLYKECMAKPTYKRKRVFISDGD